MTIPFCLSHDLEQVTLLWGQKKKDSLSAKEQNAQGNTGNDETKCKTAAKRGLGKDQRGVSANGVCPERYHEAMSNLTSCPQGFVCFHPEYMGKMLKI